MSDVNPPLGWFERFRKWKRSIEDAGEKLFVIVFYGVIGLALFGFFGRDSVPDMSDEYWAGYRCGAGVTSCADRCITRMPNKQKRSDCIEGVVAAYEVWS